MSTEIDFCIPINSETIPTINNNYVIAQVEAKTKETVSLLKSSRAHVLRLSSMFSDIYLQFM